MHFPAATELALPALGNHFARSMLAHKEFKVEVLSYQVRGVSHNLLTFHIIQ